jgi:hypothetical protein
VTGPGLPVPGAHGPSGAGADAVHLRMLVVGGLPLLVAGVGDQGRGAQLRERLDDAGLVALDRFVGADLPRGARVGFVLDTQELRLVDERDDALLRAPRSGVDAAWLAAARRLKGTMTVVATGLEVDATTPPPELARRIDQLARDGHVIGAIVGVIEERPSLPLLFE